MLANEPPCTPRDEGRAGGVRPSGFVLLAAAVVVAWADPVAIPADDGPAAERSGLTEGQAKALATFNRGCALMEQYAYAKAAAAFVQVLDVAPGWTPARFNLGLAYFNLHGQERAEERLRKARQVFAEILEAHPGHRHARFCLGLLEQHEGNDAEALEHFRAVLDADPDSPYVAYKVAETLLGLGRNDEGLKMLERVLDLDPGFVSAIYRLALLYRRTGKPKEAMVLFRRFKVLNEAELSGGSHVVQKTYGMAGRYYRVLGPDSLPLPVPRRPGPQRVVFSPDVQTFGPAVQAWEWGGGTVALPGLAVEDVDGDGDLDVCVTAAGADGAVRLWLNDGAGGFEAGPALGARGVSPCFGDVDNDGDPDLWLGRAGPDVLMTNDGAGRFAAATPDGVAGANCLTIGARMVDLDSDGDLDLLALRLAAGSVPAGGESKAAASGLHNNNRNGTFTDVAGALGLGPDAGPVATAVYDDFDDDRDLDLAVFPADGRPPIILVNDRGGVYNAAEADATGLDAAGVVGATTGDPDKDGDRDVLVFTGDRVTLYRNVSGMRFERDADFAARHGGLGGTGGQFADLDNDGDLDLVIADAHRDDGTRGLVLLVNDWPRDRFRRADRADPGHLLAAVETGGPASCVAADMTGDGRCDLLLACAGRPLRLIRNVTEGGHWIAIDARGTRGRDQKTRSNASAIGARVEVKTGRVFQQYRVGGCAGPVAMPPLRIHAGLGPYTRVDWLRVVWPDAVLQSELELPGDRVARVVELSRKTSSCPCLFAWTGERFAFVSDFAGVGGVGYWVAPNTYATPDPTEYVPVPDLAPKGGDYVLQVTEPLEEISYLDEATLLAVDHPAGTHAVPNEMMAIRADPPDFEVFCYRDPIAPIRAVDHRGRDVTDRLRRVDRRYAGATTPDRRFMGLAEDHFVELDFGDRLARVPAGARLVLLAHGWVEYGYSSTNYAAHQAGRRAKAPSLYVRRDGRWVELFREVGYPAGIRHMMTLEVTGKVRPGDRRLRIASNMEVYWDRLVLIVHEEDPPVRVTLVAARSADLHFLGFPREYSPDGRHPNLYDYENVDTSAPFKLMTGAYTRYGPVTDLVRRTDDRYAILGPGDEVTLRYPVEAFGPVPEGWRRSFILKTDSYCKDMDLYTAFPDTVGPLPFHGMSRYPYGPDERYPETPETRAYRRQYNTRHVFER